jgi:hypothetical protein
MTAARKKASRIGTKLIAFKVSPDLYAEIETYAATQKDEAGVTLSTALAARRLMLVGLEQMKRKKTN